MGLFGFTKTASPPELEMPAELPAEPPLAAVPTLQAGPRGTFVPMEDLLQLVVDEGASDLHISVGAPPCVRLNGRLLKLETRALFPEDIEKLVGSVATPEQIQTARKDG